MADDLASAPPPPAQACANCGAPVAERYCSRCGQDRGGSPHVPFRELLAELVGEALSLDGRLLRTLVPFLVRPGFLTAEYLAGRRARYASPIRLYLLTTVIFFLAVSCSPSATPPIVFDAPAASAGAPSLRFSIAPDAQTAAQAPPPAQAMPPATPAATPTGEAAPAAPAARPGAPGLHRPSDAERAELRRELQAKGAASGAVTRWLLGRVSALAELPPEEASRRYGQELLQAAPRVLFLLVPVMAGLLLLLHRGARRYFAEHLVFALHTHALGFALLTPGVLLDLEGLVGAGVAATGLHVLLGQRRVYALPWPATLWRFAVLGALYLVALVFGVGGAALLALALV